MRPIALVFAVLMYSASATHPPAPATQPPAPGLTCGCIGTPKFRATLYLGSENPIAEINATRWEAFLDKEVDPRFPQGYTRWATNGRLLRPDGKTVWEHTLELLLIHEDTPASRQNIAGIIEHYKQKYPKQSVLRETAPIWSAN
jgi:hypothetical protein